MTSLVGWFAVTAELAGLAVDGMLADILGFSSPTLLIVLMGISCSIPAIVGFESVRWLSWLSVPGLLLLAVWLLAAVLEEQSFSQLIDYRATGEVTFMTGVDWVIGGLIVGVFIASDFSRYVKSRGHNWAGGMMGVIPASVFLGLIGTLSKLSTGDWNPVNAVQALGMGIPALIIILFATWTSNDVNLYSSGIALTNLFPKLERWQSTLLFSVIGTTLAALRITEHFETFLATLAFAFSPLVGVVLCDFFVIRRLKLNLPEAYAPRGELYYVKGVNPVAWIATLAGFFVGMALPSDWVASLAGLLFAAAIYWVGMRIFCPERSRA
jgi:cytosine permease